MLDRLQPTGEDAEVTKFIGVQCTWNIENERQVMFLKREGEGSFLRSYPLLNEQALILQLSHDF